MFIANIDILLVTLFVFVSCELSICHNFYIFFKCFYFCLPSQLSRSFSDASSWLAKAKISDTPLVSEQRSQRPKSSLNKTDEDKVKDEIKDLKENQCRLEMVS